MTNSHSALKRPHKPATQEVISFQARSSQTQAPELPPQPVQEPEASQMKPQTQQQPAKPKPKLLQDLDSATNAAGEQFTTGDRIQVSAPWGGKAEAEIVSLYRDDSGNVWAKYIPHDSKADWSWESGFIRAERLVKS